MGRFIEQLDLEISKLQTMDAIGMTMLTVVPRRISGGFGRLLATSYSRALASAAGEYQVIKDSYPDTGCQEAIIDWAAELRRRYAIHANDVDSIGIMSSRAQAFMDIALCVDAVMEQA